MERYRPGWALALVTGACVLMTLDITIVNVALPRIRDDLNADLDALQWIITGYTLAFASLLLTGGALADRTGHRRVFVLGLTVFTAASLGAGLAPDVLTVDILRAVQGAGGAFAFAPAMAIIAAAYPGPARTKAIAVFGASAMAGGALGPLVGGALVEAVGWRSLFLVNVPLGVLLVALTLLRMRPDQGPWRIKLDVAGVLTLAVGMSAITLTLLRGGQQGWDSTATRVQAAVGVAGLAAFVLSQRYGRAPMLDLALFRIGSFTAVSCGALLARSTSFGLLAYLVLFLEGGYALDTLGVGVRLLGLSLALIVGGLTAARLAARIPPGVLTGSGFVICAIGLLSFTLADAAGSWARLLPGLILLGLGQGIVATPSMTIAMGVVAPERTGTASGVINSFLPLGTALGTAAFGVLFTRSVTPSPTPGQLSEAIHTIGLTAAAVALLGALLSVLLIRRSDMYAAHPAGAATVGPAAR